MGDKADIEVVELEHGTAVSALVDSDETWLEVHDMLLDKWWTIYQQVRAEQGFPLGKQAVLPVPVVCNVTCMHNCGCENNSDFMFGIAGHQEGSRHEALRLVMTCEPCLRGTGAAPAPEVEAKEGRRGPIQ